MALDLYLVVVDNSGATVTGQGQPARLNNPFRGNVNVTRPFVVTSYSFSGDVAVGQGGAAIGRTQLSELTVEMADDAAAATLFQNLVGNRRMRSVDVLAVAPGEKPAVVGGVGVSPAYLTGASWAATATGMVRRLMFDGSVFALGSAVQRPDGVYERFTFSQYDTTANA